MWRLAPLVLAGCHVVFNVDDTVDASVDAPVDTAVDGRPGCGTELVDIFDELTGIWSVEESDHAAVKIDGGALRISLVGAQDENARIFSAEDSLLGATTDIELLEVPVSPPALTYVQWNIEAVWYGLGVYEGELYFGVGHEDEEQIDERMYDPAQHRHLRITHEVGNDRLAFWTSADGQAWELLGYRAVMANTDLRRGTIEMGAGSPTDAIVSGDARFDNFRLCRP